MRVLITGATGFIGSALCMEMIKNGHEVTALIRPDSKKKEKISSSINVIELSLDNLEKLEGKYDLFYHLAWNGSSGNDRNDFDMQYSNIKYTAIAIKTAKKCDCKKFIGAGSQAEYGVVHGMAKEDETVCKPFMMYGAAKLATYNMGKIVAEKEGISFVWSRIYSIYGPGQNQDTLISYLTKTLMDGKEPKLSHCENMWNFMYIDDCTRALRMIGENNVAEGIYNIASSDSRILKDYIKEARNIINPNVNLDFGAKKGNLNKTFWLNPSIDKIEKIFKCNVNFNMGIRKIIKARSKENVL